MTTDFSYVGLEGEVVHAISAGRRGEVKVQTERGTEILFARTAPDVAIPRGARVIVVDYHGGRHADVAEWDPLQTFTPGPTQGEEHKVPPEVTATEAEVYNVLDLDQPRDSAPED